MKYGQLQFSYVINLTHFEEFLNAGIRNLNWYEILFLFNIPQILKLWIAVFTMQGNLN